MSTYSEWASRSPSAAHPSMPSTPNFERNLALLVVLLLLGGLSLSTSDAWPSTIKRLIWETLVFLTPDRLVYAAEYGMLRYRGIHGAEPAFRPEHFGDHRAKVEALQRLLRIDDSRFATTFHRVRALSGINRVLGVTDSSQPSGLGNWDNSCYQNSVLQGLASLPAFGAFISCNLDKMEEQNGSPTHHALADIIGRLNGGENNAGTLWTPSVLKSMDSWQQQDAQEYLSKLIDTVDQELSRFGRNKSLSVGLEKVELLPRWTGPRSIPLSNPLEGLLAQRVACKQCGHTEGLSLMPFNCLTINMGRQCDYDLEDLLDEHTALEDIEGVECVKCTFVHVRSQLEQLLSRSMASDTNDNSTSALKMRSICEARLAAIQKVFADDSFSESGILKRCNISAKSQVSSVKSKQVALARPPKDLIIHINRSIFDEFGNQRKNTATVLFPPTFDVGRWCLGVKSSGANTNDFEHWSMTSTESILPMSEQEVLDVSTVYELRCVVTHYGRHENGHYVAYGKRRSSVPSADFETGKAKDVHEQWYCFNDEIVTPVSENDVLDKGNVFMLFYEAVERPPVSQPAEPTAKQTFMDAAVGSPILNDTQRTEDSGKTAARTEKVTDENAQDSGTDDRNAETSSVQGLNNNPSRRGSEVPPSGEPPEKAPQSVTGSHSNETSSGISGLTRVMRTSSASPTLSRMERRESAFTMPPSSIISAV